MDDLVVVPIQNNNDKKSFVRTINTVFVKSYSECILPVKCSNYFNNNNVKIEALPGCQFKQFGLASSVSTVHQARTVCRI